MFRREKRSEVLAMAASEHEEKKSEGRRTKNAMLFLFLLFAFIIFAYLIRLEAHTRADIFLPTKYHSTMDTDNQDTTEHAETDEALDAYYAQYAQQEGRPYSIRQDLLLSWLAGIKAPVGFRGETEGITVGDLCHEVKRVLMDTATDAQQVFGFEREEVLSIASEFGEQGLLRDLVIREYIESANGFAAYVLGSEDEITIALRGTDDMIDVVDSVVLLPFNLSVQYRSMRAILDAYGDANRIWLTGHSKGGHNAIYAASIDSRCYATGFNAPGFGIFLTNAQHDGLDRGVNYVINGDVTGFLLFHLERRIVLESAGSAPLIGFSFSGRHRLGNFHEVDDLTVASTIEPFAKWTEWITQIVWLFLIFLALYGMIKLLRKMLGGIWRKIGS